MQTEEYLIERGLRAERIIRSDDFNDLFESVITEIGREILETPLEDPTKYREHLFLTVHGMRALSDRFTRYVSEMVEIVKTKDEANDTQEED